MILPSLPVGVINTTGYCGRDNIVERFVSIARHARSPDTVKLRARYDFIKMREHELVPDVKSVSITQMFVSFKNAEDHIEYQLRFL